ncbi:DUF4229 domain-containing protein [Microbacterium sp.]|uniref:DUF4229 domain-containing protein n=1 Tax=Microbacterium sp. TaxID=51671 RepID=UPI0037C9A9BA
MKVPPVLVYSVLRLLAFLVPLGLMLLLPIFRQNWLIAVVFAALLGLSLSLLFLRQPRAAVAQGLAKRRSDSRSLVPDEDAEDELSADERPRE